MRLLRPAQPRKLDLDWAGLDMAWHSMAGMALNIYIYAYASAYIVRPRGFVEAKLCFPLVSLPPFASF